MSKEVIGMGQTYDKRRFGRAKKRTIDLMDDGSVAGM